ncbi:MAG: phage terminase large subunit family protein, partial [Cetobacterium sp.]
MDAINDRSVSSIVIMSSAQVGKTEMLLNLIGYHIHHDPSPILLMQPTLEMAEAFSKDRLMPMMRDTPAITGRIDAQTRNSGNTILHKKFPGGHLTIAGANSPSSLASRPIRIVLADEVDRYPASAGSEGDPVSLAAKRTATFWNRKIVLTSTPTVKGKSRIESAYMESDQRRYYVPCPHCDHRQTLKWPSLDYSTKGTPQAPVYICESCEEPISEAHKRAMLAKGEWIADEPGRTSAGFAINELYSPWRYWREIVADFLHAKDDPERLKTWVNTSLGETWEEQGDIDGDLAERLLMRCERYPAQVPSGALLLTVGVDVQTESKNPRLEASVWGWSEKEGWLIDHAVLYGHPIHDPGVWEDLADYLATDWKHESGHAIRVSAGLIDSGDGNVTDRVYEFTKPREADSIFASKGQGGDGLPIIGRGQRQKKHPLRPMLYHLGVDQIKAALMSRLQSAKEPGAGFLHFPIAAHIGLEYFEQLTG